MNKRNADRLNDLVGNIDGALARCPALTEQQLQDVRILRAKVLQLWQSGKMEEAIRCEKLALNIIREGAPVPE